MFIVYTQQDAILKNTAQVICLGQVLWKELSDGKWTWGVSSPCMAG
jgi:hypothetical protein